MGKSVGIQVSVGGGIAYACAKLPYVGYLFVAGQPIVSGISQYTNKYTTKSYDTGKIIK